MPAMLMRSIAAVIVCLAVLAGPAVGAGAAADAGAVQDFVPGFEDLPLMPGLSGDPKGGVGMDTPSGRIVEAEAAGEVTARAVRAFYNATLPQLGWTRAGRDAWLREGERLTIDIDGDRSVSVRFTITPQ